MQNNMVKHEISHREIKNKEISRLLALEGIVLMENDGILPFKKDNSKIALYGNGARRTIKGGTGSGDVNVRDFVTIEQGLLNAGYEIVSKNWLEKHDQFIEKEEKDYDETIRNFSKEYGPQKGLLQMMGHPFEEPVFQLIKKEELQDADVAIYVLARTSGEGADRQLKEGDYYLTKQELMDIQLLANHYEQMILLLNIGGVIDMKQIKQIEGINAIVNVSQGGSGFGDAVADIFSGKETPSGKLTATWPYNYEDYPNSNEFSDLDGDEDDSYYREGIFVGYRYFDSFGIQPIYPFGFGKSYTDFRMEAEHIGVIGEGLHLEVAVTNVGSKYSGKEVAQLYVSAPKGKLQKPYQELRAFEKTKMLYPGETDKLNLMFSLRDMASYDSNRSAYVLEKGEYLLRLGGSSVSTKVVGIVVIPEEVVTEQCCPLFHNNDFEEIQIRKEDTPSEMSGDHGSKIIVEPTSIPIKINDYCNKRKKIKKVITKNPITFDDVQQGRHSIKNLVGQLSLNELSKICVGGARSDMKDFSFVGNAADTIPGAAGETTFSLSEKRKIPSVAMADGPAGIRVNPKYYIKDGKILRNPAEDPIFSKILTPELAAVDLSGATTHYQYCTALPIATMLAQSWNKDVLFKAGFLVGEEMKEFGIDIWLAPGMNIQRNPLGGRNFEYYSEDPLLSGVFAAATTKGIHKHPGISTSIKHLAVNSQETNRNYNNSQIHERAIREIYLKGFEICVKTEQPYTAMTSVNLINGIHAANHLELLTSVLRNEWGFDGVVMTDWGTTSAFGVDIHSKKYGVSTSEGCIIAGNDLIMPGTQKDEDRLMEAVEGGRLDISHLQWCAENIIKMIIKLKK